MTDEDYRKHVRVEEPVRSHDEAPAAHPPETSDSTDSSVLADENALQLIVRNIRYLVSEDLGSDLEFGNDDPTLGFRIERRVFELLGEEEISPMSLSQRQAIADDVIDDLLGLGPLQRPLDDPTVTAVLVNGPSSVFVERAGSYVAADRGFDAQEHLRHVVDRLLTVVGRSSGDEGPIVEERMPDGSRVNIVMPPLASDGPVVVIQKTPQLAFSAEDLVSFGTLDDSVSEFLHRCVVGRLNILVSGSLGTGRTTLLSLLGSWIPSTERIITVEEAAELRLSQPQVVRLETQLPDMVGDSGIGLRELLRIALRMRPGRIVLGEVEGGEAFDMLLAMGSGDDGWMSTIHAASPEDALGRFEMLALLAAGSAASTRALRAQISSAFDIVVQLEKMRDGTRRITRVVEVGDSTEDDIELRDLFVFEADGDIDSTGRLSGSFTRTSAIPVFADRIAMRNKSGQLDLDL